MTPNLADIDNDIADVQAKLNRLLQQRARASAVYATALSSRPSGLDPTWLPDIRMSGTTAVVIAWFDPSFYGRSIT